MIRFLGGVLLGLVLAGCAASYTNRELMAEFAKYGLDARETARGVVVTFPSEVFFAFGKDTLTPTARTKVGDMATVLNNRRAGRRAIAIEGHTDAIGSEEDNQALSERRADRVAQELIFSQVREDRTTIRGYGENQPIAPNTHPDGTDDPEGRAKNRRVEVVVGNL